MKSDVEKGRVTYCFTQLSNLISNAWKQAFHKSNPTPLAIDIFSFKSKKETPSTLGQGLEIYKYFWGIKLLTALRNSPSLSFTMLVFLQ
jgi:hypothetical protein